MEWSRTLKLMIRWTALTATLIAGFWGTWHLVAGSVPIASNITMIFGPWTQLLPGMSRWWDVLFGPVFPIVFIFIFTHGIKMAGGTLNITLTGGLIMGLICGIGLGFSAGLILALCFFVLITTFCFIFAYGIIGLVKFYDLLIRILPACPEKIRNFFLAR